MVKSDFIDYKYIERTHIDASFPINSLVTIAICTNKISYLKKYFLNYYRNILVDEINIIIVFDDKTTELLLQIVEELKSDFITIVLNEHNKGLSYSRNKVLDICKTQYVIFVDDEVTFTTNEVAIIGKELFDSRNNIVGCFISGPIAGLKIPFYISPGQLHYLGIHNEYDKKKIPWGAFVGIDLYFCKVNNIKFNFKLGRYNTGLQSGDDTTFIFEIQKAGGKVSFIENCVVYHNIDTHRIRLPYLVKRVYWQGKSEVLRDNAINGLKKEISRYLQVQHTSIFKIYFLAIIFSSIFIIGMVYQYLINGINSLRFR